MRASSRVFPLEKVYLERILQTDEVQVFSAKPQAPHQLERRGGRMG